MDYVNAFLCGGLLCAVGQIIIDKTKLTPARILVGYVVTGVFLQAVGVYQHLVDWGGAGATVPLTGFGYTLARGVEKAVAEKGLLGILTGLLLIPALYSTDTGALGIHLTWVDISIFYVAAALAYLLETRLLTKEQHRPCRFARAAMLLTLTLAFVFLFFTYFPPRLPIFLDPVTMTYGLSK